VAQPGALLDLAVSTKLVDAVAGIEQLLGPLTGPLKTDWKSALRRMAGGGITYAVYPGDTNVVIVDASDAEAFDALQQMARPLPAPPAKAFYVEFPAVAAWSFDGKQFFARTASRLVMTNRGEALKKLFDPRPAEMGNLAAWAPYTQALKAAGDGAVGTYFLNLALLKQAPQVRKALGEAGSPIEILLNGAVRESLNEASWVGVALRIEGRSLVLRAACDGQPAAKGAGAFSTPEGAGVLPNLKVPGELAGVSLWRDLHKFYAAKETLFPEKTSGGVLLENFMEIFFTGRDLTGEVFARFQPAVRLVVARQKYDAKIGTPLEQYPAAALVFRINQAEEFGEIFEEAWQKAIGLFNFTRGQAAQPGLILDRATHAGVTYTYGYYTARNEKDRARLPSRFNTRPALARAGPYLIVSSTDGLARDLIDAVNREDQRVAAGAGAHTVLEVGDGSEIAALVATNRAELVRQDVTKSGKKPEAAAAELETNLSLLRHVERARISMETTAEGQRAQLELRLK
jgi:hypothetical protein